MAKAAVGTAETLKESVLERLRGDIVFGVLPPGTIVRDLELSRRYGASTSPVREALHQLVAEGLIDMPANRPKQVSHLSRKEALELVAVHRLLADAAYVWGAPRVDRSGVEEMRQALEQVEQCSSTGDMRGWSAATGRFNDVILRAADNRSLRRMVSMSFAAIERIVILWKMRGLMDPQALRGILAALEAGQPDEAVFVFRKLFEEFQRDIETLAFRL